MPPDQAKQFVSRHLCIALTVLLLWNTEISLAPVRGEGGRRPGGTDDGSAMGDAVAASNELLEALAKRAIALNGQWQKAKT